MKAKMSSEARKLIYDQDGIKVLSRAIGRYRSKSAKRAFSFQGKKYKLQKVHAISK